MADGIVGSYLDSERSIILLSNAKKQPERSGLTQNRTAWQSLQRILLVGEVGSRQNKHQERMHGGSSDVKEINGGMVE